MTVEQDPLDRLRAALIAQTVDALTVVEDRIEFTPKVGGNRDKPRPEGAGWMLEGLGRGVLRLQRDAERVSVHYDLNCRLGFYIVSAFAIGAIILIHLSGGPDYRWGWAFGSGCWIVMFLSSYVSKTIEFRRWIRGNLTSNEPLPVKGLSVPHDPG